MRQITLRCQVFIKFGSFENPLERVMLVSALVSFDVPCNRIAESCVFSTGKAIRMPVTHALITLSEASGLALC